MTTWQILINDPLTWKAIELLLDRGGLCEEYVTPILRGISGLPEIWESQNKETPDARKDRRHILAHKMRLLAIAMESDPEARHYRIFDHTGITTDPIEDKPTITDILKFTAEDLEKKGKGRDRYDAYVPTKTTSPGRKPFVQREIAKILFFALNNPDKNPIEAARLLSNVILNPIPGEEVTPGQMKSVFRELRKKR